MKFVEGVQVGVGSVLVFDGFNGSVGGSEDGCGGDGFADGDEDGLHGVFLLVVGCDEVDCVKKLVIDG